jgi:methyl-accepting chemotaxis protein
MFEEITTDFRSSVAIRAKVIAALVAAFAITLVIGAIALRGAGDANEKAVDIRDNWLPSIRILFEISSNAEQYRSLEGQFLLSKQTSEWNELDRLMKDVIELVEIARTAYEPLITPGKERELADRLFRDWDQYQIESRNIIATARHNDVGVATKLYMGDHYALFHKIRATLAADVALNEAGGVKSADDGTEVQRQTRLYVLGAVGIAVLICVVAGLLIMASLSRPVVAASEPRDQPARR